VSARSIVASAGMTQSAVAVLLVVAKLERAYTAEIAEHAGIAPVGTLRLLRRLHQLWLVDREQEEGDPHELGRTLRVYYTLTEPGRLVVTKLRGGEA
jgi:DNA-binding MarR family transcriptional regulator